MADCSQVEFASIGLVKERLRKKTMKCDNLWSLGL